MAIAYIYETLSLTSTYLLVVLQPLLSLCSCCHHHSVSAVTIDTTTAVAVAAATVAACCQYCGLLLLLLLLAITIDEKQLLTSIPQVAFYGIATHSESLRLRTDWCIV
jgi:hypothetical protein